MNEWLNKIKWMYCNIQWVELLSHHQPIHYTERERERESGMRWIQSKTEEKEDPGRRWKSCIYLKNDFPVEALQTMTSDD